MKDLNGEFDARIWASEFKKQYPEMDEEILFAWFANAIMSGYDCHHKQRYIPLLIVFEQAKRVVEAAEILLEECPKTDGQESRLQEAIDEYKEVLGYD